MRQRLRTKVRNLLGLIEYLSNPAGMLPWVGNHRKLSFLLDFAEWFSLIILVKNPFLRFLYTILSRLWNLRRFDGQDSSGEYTGRTFLVGRQENLSQWHSPITISIHFFVNEATYYVKVETRNSTARKLIVHNLIAIINLEIR